MSVALLTNRTPAAERRRIADGLRAGTVDILVGTHALIYGGVEFANLGVAVIDEQHRFGVEQRDLLRGKGDSPDVLVMTATPIPRTAAMLIYGDLDKTELRHLPAGRSPIDDDGRRRGTTRTRRRVRTRARARWPRDARPTWCVRWSRVPTSWRRAPPPRSSSGSQHEELAGLRLGLLHGQMPAAEKEAAMRAFRERRDRRARGHHRDRGGRRRAERDRDGDRGRRPLRSAAAAPAARPHRPRQAQVVLLPARRTHDAAG